VATAESERNRSAVASIAPVAAGAGTRFALPERTAVTLAAGCSAAAPTARAVTNAPSTRSLLLVRSDHVANLFVSLQ
jgi:hypothetical protein